MVVMEATGASVSDSMMGNINIMESPNEGVISSRVKVASTEKLSMPLEYFHIFDIADCIGEKKVAKNLFSCFPDSETLEYDQVISDCDYSPNSSLCGSDDIAMSSHSMAERDTESDGKESESERGPMPPRGILFNRRLSHPPTKGSFRLVRNTELEEPAPHKQQPNPILPTVAEADEPKKERKKWQIPHVQLSQSTKGKSVEDWKKLILPSSKQVEHLHQSLRDSPEKKSAQEWPEITSDTPESKPSQLPDSFFQPPSTPPGKSNSKVLTLPVFDFRGPSRTWSGSLTRPAPKGANLRAGRHSTGEQWPTSDQKLIGVWSPRVNKAPEPPVRSVSVPLGMFVGLVERLEELENDKWRDEMQRKVGGSESDKKWEEEMASDGSLQFRDENWGAVNSILTIDDFYEDSGSEAGVLESETASRVTLRETDSNLSNEVKPALLICRSKSMTDSQQSPGKPPLHRKSFSPMKPEVVKLSQNDPGAKGEGFDFQQWKLLLKEAKDHARVSGTAKAMAVGFDRFQEKWGSTVERQVKVQASRFCRKESESSVRRTWSSFTGVYKG